MRKKVFPHHFRHLFARAFCKMEKEIARPADILGHCSIDTAHIPVVSTGEEHRRQPRSAADHRTTESLLVHHEILNAGSYVRIISAEIQVKMQKSMREPGMIYNEKTFLPVFKKEVGIFFPFFSKENCRSFLLYEYNIMRIML